SRYAFSSNAPEEVNGVTKAGIEPLKFITVIPGFRLVFIAGLLRMRTIAMLVLTCKHLGLACRKFLSKAAKPIYLALKTQHFVNDYFTECLDDVTLQFHSDFTLNTNGIRLLYEILHYDRIYDCHCRIGAVSNDTGQWQAISCFSTGD
ncbi:MAG: hypothetical protein ACR2O0_02095, partial [Rhizobiaceae bacterium]